MGNQPLANQTPRPRAIHSRKLGRPTSHFHGKKYSWRRHRFNGISRFAQLSRYARGSLASLMASRDAAETVSGGRLEAGERHTGWRRVAVADGRLNGFCNSHDGAIGGRCRARGAVGAFRVVCTWDLLSRSPAYISRNCSSIWPIA